MIEYTNIHIVAEGGDVSYSSLFSSTQHKAYTKKALNKSFLIKCACPGNQKEESPAEKVFLCRQKGEVAVSQITESTSRKTISSNIQEESIVFSPTLLLIHLFI